MSTSGNSNTSKVNEVLLYCIRTVVSEQCSGARRPFYARQQTASVDRARPTTLTKSTSRLSVLEILNATHATSKDKKKFPKELIKALEDALKRVIMRQEPAYDDPLLRSTFGAFYIYYLSDAFQKTMKDNRKIEDLILMFFSKATTDLQKRVPELQSKQIVLDHVAKFVRLLLKTIRGQKLGSGDSEIVLRLVDYEKKLLQNAEILGPTATKEESPTHEEGILAVRVRDNLLLQKLASLFDLPTESVQTVVDIVVTEASDEVHLRDLKLLLEQVQSQSGIAFRSGDFCDENSYAIWRQQEMSDLTGRILRLTNANPQLAKAPSGTESTNRSRSSSFSVEHPTTTRFSNMSLQNSSSTTDAIKSFYFIPSDPFDAYKRLLELTLLKDRGKSEEIDTDGRTSFFTKPTTDILAQCKARWRITDIQHKIGLLHACCTAYIENQMTLDDLDQAFFDVESLNIHDDQFLTHPLQTIYTNDLLSLNDALFRELYEELQNIYDDKIDPQVLTFMSEYIYSDPCFSAAASQAAHMFDELEVALQQIAEHRYRAQRDATCAPAELEILRVVRLADILQKDITLYRKRYPKALLDVINVWEIFLKVAWAQFLYDLKPLLEQCYRNAKAQGLDFAIEDMFQLYRSVSDVLQKLQTHEPSFVSPVNVDLYFRPYILKWLQQADSAIMSLVPKVLDADDFRPQNDDTQSNDCSSESIALLFKSLSQHLAFLRELRWPDEYWAAKFVTILSHTFSNAVREYSLLIQDLFLRECATVSQEVAATATQADTIQRRLITKAREALAKRELPEPLNISSSACIQLNNIVCAKNYLNVLEGSVNSAELTSIVEKYEGGRESWSSGQSVLFSVKIIAAHDITTADNNGFSDAYVVLSDQKGKRIGKTRAIYTNMSPQWDESFDIGTSETIWLAATIWNRSATGEHDFCGRCYFKLDPSSHKDLIPKESHLALDTQGLLQIRITMEIETDQSTFHFSRAFRYLNRAETEMSRAIVERMTPFLNTALSRHNLRSLQSKSLTIDATLGSAYNLLSKAGFAAGSRTSTYAKDKNMIPSNQDIEAPIEPLMQYLDDNFRTLDHSLNRSAFTTVMSKLWDHVISTIEYMIVPQLTSRGKKAKRALSEEELDAAYKWLGFLKDTFAGDGGGLSPEELQTPRYHELLSIRFFYFDNIEDLMQECERMAVTNTAKMRQVGEQPLVLRKAYNLGTIRQNRDEKRAYQRALSSSEDIILRVLRLRGNAQAQEFVDKRLLGKTRNAAFESVNQNVMRQSTIHSRTPKADFRMSR